MKTKRIFYSIALVAATTLTFTSCDDYLDKMPDNRTLLDTEDKISDLLATAYPQNTYALVNELMSDNTDYYGDNNPNYTIFGDDAYFWRDEKEENNQSMESLWTASYEAIAKSNQALASLDEYKFDDSTAKGIRAEALLCRAYNHFILVSQFSKAYNATTSNKDLGIPVSTQVEELLAQKERGTVADDYAQIEKDLEEGLKDVTDNYDVPKYHFNQKAAYAFATRFYLFYEKWDKAVEYANKCLGSNPQTVLRNWKEFGELPQDRTTVTNHYINADLNANLLLCTSVSDLGVILGEYSYYKRYSHGSYLSKNEDLEAHNIWGPAKTYVAPFVTSGTNADVTFIQKIPYLFQTVDPVSGAGRAHTVLPVFNTDETLLNRAEAYIMLKQYDKAAADLTMWMRNYVDTKATLTPESIQTFYNSVKYCYSDPDKILSTIKKHLNPAFTIDAEGSVQECMLQCVLGFRRFVTLGEGMRWWDIKRYGIEIPRREMSIYGTPLKNRDWLGKDDLRRAVQIPKNVREAGLAGNPRN
jgi:tetratricopeptide (TPR) repeat protein